MEQLLALIPKFDETSASVGKKYPDFPQICVIGSQSSGKSSVLERIVGKDFLPCGQGVVTRRPLILKLIHISQSNSGPATEWGEFLHQKGKVYTNFHNIRQEIVAETERHCRPFGISNNPIYLSIYSPKLPNLTLVDLPGLARVIFHGPPPDLPEIIRSMILQYIKNPNTIILCVVGANTDIYTSEAIQLAKEVDPEGHRTLGVITKIDLMDRGTDAMSLLSETMNRNHLLHPLPLRFVGVIMRSMQDIRDKKTIEDALQDEENFFARHPSYRPHINQLGTIFFLKLLCSILLHLQTKFSEL